MDQTKSAPNRSSAIPPNPANLPPPPPPHQNPHPPPATTAPPPPLDTKKRNANTHHVNYFKLRALVKELRPSFIEVLRTPDIQNSKVALEIRTKMNLVMDICKQINVKPMKVEASTEMSKKPFEGQSLPGETKDVQKPVDKHPEEDLGKSRHPDHIPEKSADIPKSVDKQEEKRVKRQHPDRLHDKSPDVPKPIVKQEEKPAKRHQPDRVGEKSAEVPWSGLCKEEENNVKGSYVIGGSNFGWNFIMYPPVNKPVYYGVTKESRQMSKEKMDARTQAPNK